MRNLSIRFRAKSSRAMSDSENCNPHSTGFSKTIQNSFQQRIRETRATLPSQGRHPTSNSSAIYLEFSFSTAPFCGLPLPNSIDTEDLLDFNGTTPSD